jgi:phosphoribosylformylglycinamidine synthase
MIARVFVTLKAGVLDPQGRAVAHALAAEGFNEVQDARVGKLIEVQLDETDASRARERLKSMCEKLLANTVIERYEIDVPKSS